MEQEASPLSTSHGQHQSIGRLGPLLCWAVVFADIGSSIYYVPGILYGRVGNLAGFFVLLTMSVFVLLTLKYAEVSARFPEGGGVVSVAAQAINSWVGALGGMFILVSYFLTAAISCLSAIQYFSVVFPAIAPFILEITISVLVLLGILNWVG
ncbi:MAG: amino acid permease, partial [Ktedonobacteraceae bacterium]